MSTILDAPNGEIDKVEEEIDEIDSDETSSDETSSDESSSDESDEKCNVKTTGTPKCQYCDREFSSNQALNYHVNAAICFGTLYTCKRCLKPFILPWKLKRHKDRKVRCNIQNKVVITRMVDKNKYITKPFEDEKVKNTKRVVKKKETKRVVKKKETKHVVKKTETKTETKPEV